MHKVPGPPILKPRRLPGVTVWRLAALVLALAYFSRWSYSQESFFWYPDSSDSRMDMGAKRSRSKPGRPLPDSGDLTRVSPGALKWLNSGHFVPDWKDGVTKDFDVELKVSPQPHADEWARGGLLFVENRAAGTDGAWCVLAVTGHSGVVFNANGDPGSGQVHRIAGSGEITLPVWLRLQRSSHKVTGYFKSSPAGEWQLVGEAMAPNSVSPLAGVAEMLILREERVPPAMAQTPN